MIGKVLTWITRKPFCPTEKEINNGELKKLARRLKGQSIEETLTNVLEWIEENIRFWTLRWPFSTIFVFFLLSSILVAIIALTFDIYNLLLCLIGGVIVLAIYFFTCLLVIYNLIFRHEGVKSRIRKILSMIYDTFRGGLPVEKILNYKLAVCRDYARLTSSILFNIYPSHRIYFLDYGSHVAVAVKIKDRYYVLDQYLPILTSERWLACQNKKKVTVYVSELLHNSEGKIDVCFEKYGFLRRQEISINVDTKELTKKLVEELKISQTSQKANPDFEIPLKNYALYYEDDEIVKYSLIRAIKNKLRKELCNNIRKISKIEIRQKEKDLILEVYLS